MTNEEAYERGEELMGYGKNYREMAKIRFLQSIAASLIEITKFIRDNEDEFKKCQE